MFGDVVSQLHTEQSFFIGFVSCIFGVAVKSRSAYRVTFLPIMCAFGKNLDFVTEWLDFPENRCNRKSIVDLHKRIFFQADFGCFFVIKMRFEINDKNNPDRYYWLKNNTGRDFDDVYGA